MPFYQIAEMSEGHSDINPAITSKSVAGEMMKAGIVTKPEGEGPPLHMHPNESSSPSSSTESSTTSWAMRSGSSSGAI